jgi:hypothetical protein
MATAATVAAAVAKLGAWPLALFIIWYLIRSLRNLLAAALWDLWLTSRGVDESARRQILLESARAAQKLAPSAPTSEPTAEVQASPVDAAATDTLEPAGDTTPDSRTDTSHHTN